MLHAIDEAGFMKGGKAGRQRRGGAAGGAKKNARPGARKGSAKRGGGAPKKGGKPAREFGAFQTRDEDER
jgi:hypothetical protein